MKNEDYVVRRDAIYVGEVVKSNTVYRLEGDKNSEYNQPEKLTTSIWTNYRSMLFVPDENLFSNDLLFDSPAYPVLNITDDETCLSLGNDSVFIKDACSLDKLLEYYGYPEELTLEDVKKLREIFFTGHFAKDNCQMFGWEELENFFEFKSGTKFPLIKKYLENLAKITGCRSFQGISESILPREYFNVLDDMGNTQLFDLIQWNETKINSFKPDKKEKVKKLR